MRTIFKKLMMLVWLIGCTCMWPVVAQTLQKPVTVKIENRTLKEAFELIKTQYGYSLLIRNNDIDVNKRVSANVQDGTIEKLLEQLLADTGIQYEVSENRIVVFRSSTLAKERPNSRWTVNGVVTDITGEAVIGATVSVVGADGGTITDLKGNIAVR